MDVNYLDILERMKAATRLKNDSAVARSLNITPQALSNYKKRNKLPSHLVITFASLHGLSIDWLITGRGHFRKGGEGGPIAPNAVPTATEDILPYTLSESSLNIGTLSPEELIYIGKLLCILRTDNASTTKAIKFNLDAFFRTTESSSNKDVDK